MSAQPKRRLGRLCGAATILMMFVIPGPCGLGQTDEVQNRLLSAIAERYRANQSILTSFYCEYGRDISILRGFAPPSARLQPSRGDWHEIQMKGKYASSEDRLYECEISSEPGQQAEFIRNGDIEHTVVPRGTEGRGLVRGSRSRAPIKPVFAGPWTLSGLCLAAELDRLNPQFDKIASVEVKEIDGRSVAVVVFDQRLASDPEDQYTGRVEMHFSIQDGLMPIRLIQKNMRELSFIIDTKVSEILTYDVGGTVLYLPGQVASSHYRGTELVQSFRYAVDKPSVKINPELPDSLFTVQIRPGDVLVDKEAGGIQISSELALMDATVHKSLDDISASLDSTQPSAIPPVEANSPSAEAGESEVTRALETSQRDLSQSRPSGRFAPPALVCLGLVCVAVGYAIVRRRYVRAGSKQGDRR